MNENAEEGMGRFWLAAAKCNYKEINQKLKEQFMQGLSYNEMLAEIIQELSKTGENK